AHRDRARHRLRLSRDQRGLLSRAGARGSAGRQPATLRLYAALLARRRGVDPLWDSRAGDSAGQWFDQWPRCARRRRDAAAQRAAARGATPRARLLAGAATFQAGARAAAVSAAIAQALAEAELTAAAVHRVLAAPADAAVARARGIAAAGARARAIDAAGAHE